MKKPVHRSERTVRPLAPTELPAVIGGGGTTPRPAWDWTKPATTAQDDWESPAQS
jgi:hypothetical protein